MGVVGNFDDIIEEFSKNYEAYLVKDWEVGLDGSRKTKYKKVTVRGSLQTQGRKKTISSEGASSIEHSYEFYANKKFILNEGDYIKDKMGNILIIVGLDPWEEEGDYRKYSLNRTTMTENRLLNQFIGDEDPDYDNPELQAILEEKRLM